MNRWKYVLVGLLVGAFAFPLVWVSDPLVIGQTVTVDSTQSPLVVNALADLADLTPTDGQSVIIKTGTEKGLWYYDKDSAAVVDGVAVLTGPGSVGRFLVINNDAGSIAAATAITAAQIDNDVDLEFGVFDADSPRSLTLAELKKTGVQVVNVKQYGATGDGVTDDTTEIQAAIATAASGGCVYFPAGEYLITTTITIPSYVTLLGSQVDESSIKSSAAVAVKIGRYSHIRDLRIWGNDTASSVGIGQTNAGSAGDYYFTVVRCHIADFATGLELVNAWSSSVSDTRIDSCVDYGIKITSAAVNAIGFSNCIVHGNGVNVYVDTFASNVCFDNCSIEQATTYGIRLNGAPVRGMSIRDCYFEGNASGHILNEGLSYSLSIDANSFYGSPMPITMTPSSGWKYQTGTEISANYFEDLTTARTYDIVLSSLTVRDTVLSSEGGIWTNSTSGVGVLARVSDGGLRTQRLYGVKPYDLGSVGASRAINWATCATNKTLMDQNTTLTFTAPSSPGVLTFVVEQNGTGGYTITWPSINWKTSARQPDPGAWVRSLFMFYYDGAAYYELSSNTLPIVSVEASTAGSGSPNVLDDSESMTLLTNEGTTAANYHTLPTAVAGLTYTFVVQDADGLRITAATGDTIRLGPNVTATAGYIESTTIGDVVTATAINATEWVGHAYGTWTNGTWSYAVADTP